MDKKFNNSSEFEVDEMIKNYWNVICDGQRCKIKIPTNSNLDYSFLKGCIIGFILSSIVYGIFSVIF
jgi:hypothetical protein